MNCSKRYINDLKQSMRKFLKDIAVQKSEIAAVYLFGSFARDKTRRGSDVDLAFLFDRAFYKNDPYKAFAIAQMTGDETIIFGIFKKHLEDFYRYIVEIKRNYLEKL